MIIVKSGFFEGGLDWVRVKVGGGPLQAAVPLACPGKEL